MSKTPHLSFGLGPPEIVERVARLLGGAELAAEIPAHLGHAEHRLGRDIPLVRHERGHDVDRTRALLDRLPRLSPLAFMQPNTYSARAEVG